MSTMSIPRSSSSAAAVMQALRAHFRPSIASAAERAEAYAALLLLIPGGEIAPAFDRSFPLKEAPEAWRHLIEDRPFGKVTLTVGALPDLRPYERPLALPQRRSPVP